MNSIKFYILFLLFPASAFAQNKFTSTKDVFGVRVFVENKGQFDYKTNSTEKIKFAYESGSENVYFTNKGLIHKFIKKQAPLEEKEREKGERGKKIKTKPVKVYYVHMNWLNANQNLQIIESEKQNHYFTYGGPELNSNTFKKIVYKNVYDNIDIEYTIPNNKEYGIKYNVILHPGANPSDIKISYTGDVQKIKNEKGNIVIKTPLEDIVEHIPFCYDENNETIPCNFKIEHKTIGFLFPNGLPDNQTVIIDPWVTSITSLSPYNYGLDVDYDGLGNLFVFGGLNQVKVAKYDQIGNLLWTFSGNLPGIPWTSQGIGEEYIGNFLVHKVNGKTYVGQGYEPANGVRLIRLDPAGNYDNFVTPILPTVEVWDMGFHCGSGNVYEIGGATITNLSAGLINQITAAVSSANFTGILTAGQDILSSAIDAQGNIFAIFASQGTPFVTNKIIRINNTFNGNVWMVPSTYSSFIEAGNKGNYVGGTFLSNGFNCLAVNNNYLFYYDGYNISAYNKSTGAQLGSTTIPLLSLRQQGGIDVDDCNNVYVGGIDNLFSYYFNGTSFVALPSVNLNTPSVNKYVYDLKLDRNSKLLYVSGSGFTGVYSAINSLTCGLNNGVSVNVNCASINNASVVATLTLSVASPTINYIWTNGGGTVSATMGTSLTTNAINLPNGTYTLITQVNQPCGPSYVNTLSVLCCPTITLTPTIAQAGCSNLVNSATLSVAGAGTIVPSVIWLPPPGSVGPGSLTASALPVGINTVVVNLGYGCMNSTTMNVLLQAPPVSFTINNITGSNSITCLTSSISMQAVSNYTFGTLSYSWTSISFTAGTSTVNITAANILTVTVMDPLTGCFMTQTVSVVMYTNQPVTNVNPVSQAITCNSGAPVTFSGTVSNPIVNIQHDWYSPLNPLPGGVPISTSNNTLSILSGSIPPGIYTLQTTNLVNGCKTLKTVTVTSLDAWPTFSVASTTGFSVGCAPLHQTTLSIINPVSTQTPPATCSYTFLPPSFGGVVTPSIILGGNTSTVTMVPGTWTIIVQDNSNWCRSIISVPIIQNTVAPNVSVSLFTPTLTCRNPTVIATGTSTTPNTIITWNIPQNPPLLSTPTVEIGPVSGPNTSTTSLTYANYTVIASNSLNACQTTSVVQIYQNFKPPISSPTISIGTATAIYCTVETNPVVLTTGNSTTTSGGGALAFVSNPCWQGPSPQIPLCGTSSYSVYVAGVYTLTIEDNYNGCKNTGTVNVIDKTQPPMLTNVNNISILDCGSDKATLFAAITGSLNGLMYHYIEYPVGAAFSPTNAILNNFNPLLSGTSSQSVTVSLPGYYQVAVTNTLTGCRAYGNFLVKNGELTADFIADNYSGYAPLMVTFTNNSISTNGSASITSVWSFGNGITQTNTSNINSFTSYYSPGIYTVTLFTSKGNCVDTSYKTIKVELPSKLETPNIFTPNGDGSNDIFILKTVNLGEINALIFDRWGNKVYEVKSLTGNIVWDGKNLQGKECQSGVYFYVITATGNDSKGYNVKGNVSLFR